MNNKELVSELSRRLGYTNKDALTLVGSVVDIMGERLQTGDILSFQNFGTFQVKKKVERITINPITKQRFLVPPKLVLTFKPAVSLKDKLKDDKDG